MTFGTRQVLPAHSAVAWQSDRPFPIIGDLSIILEKIVEIVLTRGFPQVCLVRHLLKPRSDQGEGPSWTIPLDQNGRRHPRSLRSRDARLRKDNPS